MEGTNENKYTLVNVISTAIQMPGVKVDRETFLRTQFKHWPNEKIQEIIEIGPINANCSKYDLQKMAHRLVNDRTIKSSGVSFATGLPGGFTMAATIPADILQFYGVALRLAQELAYLYGEADIWENGVLDNDKVTNQLILYCGVMLGASGASSTVRVLSSSLAKQALKKLPQKALTKTFYYPIVKSIAKAFGTKMTKEVFGKGVSKAIPIVGGVVSGGITFATMRPMGMRLADTFDEAHFSYTTHKFEEDWNEVMRECEIINSEIAEDEQMPSDSEIPAKNEVVNMATITEEIKKAKELLDMGVISDSDFESIKQKLIAKL